MTPELRAQIEAKHDAEPSYKHNWQTVETLLEYVKELEGDLEASEKQGDVAHAACVEYGVKVSLLEEALDWTIRNWVPRFDRIELYDRGWLVPIHLAPVLEASRKRIEEPLT